MILINWTDFFSSNIIRLNIRAIFIYIQYISTINLILLNNAFISKYVSIGRYLKENFKQIIFDGISFPLNINRR